MSLTPEQRAELTRLQEVIDAACAAYDAYAEPIEAPDMLTDYDDRPIRCAKTGVILFDTDEYVRDRETGEYWLRSALGLPPRPPEEIEEEEDEDKQEAA